jgi:hypothetical protein
MNGGFTTVDRINSEPLLTANEVADYLGVPV